MEKQEKTALRKYYAQIKRSLSGTAKEKRHLIENLKSDVEQYIIEHDNATMEMITSHFGTPVEIAEKYLFFQSDEKLRRKPKIIKTVVIIVISILVLLALICGIYLVCSEMKSYMYEIIMRDGHL